MEWRFFAFTSGSKALNSILGLVPVRGEFDANDANDADRWRYSEKIFAGVFLNKNNCVSKCRWHVRGNSISRMKLLSEINLL